MKIAIILGSTREGRVGARVGKWVLSAVEQIEGVEAKFMDLIDYDLPFMREAVSPRYNPQRQVPESVQKWLNDIADVDGYIFITPEYNRAMPAELKNAIDTIGHEGDKKPAAFVSYSGTPSGGLAAQQELRNAVNMLEMTPVPAFVVVPFAGEVLNEDGALTDAVKASGHSPDSMLSGELEQLVWYIDALKTAREKA